MQIKEFPDKREWQKLLQRPYNDNSNVIASVQTILNEVKKNGDKAIKELNIKFGGASLEGLEVSNEELELAGKAVDAGLKAAILQAQEHIEIFHRRQVTPLEVIEPMPGVKCWRRSVGIERVGLYVPGGTAPLFSTVLMLAIPAILADCQEIILCTPPAKDGNVHPAILFAAKVVGVNRIFKIGGAQAIAAMAYGTETVPPVYKIFGPGNQYVTAAKQLVQMQGVAIDMPAGPSEVCILADASASPAFLAADLLSQAEHGTDSQVLLVSTDREIVSRVIDELQKQLDFLPRKDIAEKALANSTAIIVKDTEEAVAIVNEYAAEHLIICCENADILAGRIINAGSVFIGDYSPESVGDYASGTNHTLPTNGFAKAYSGVSVDSFVKKITFQKLTKEGLNSIAQTVVAMAEAEGLQAHANAVTVRLQSFRS